MPLTLYLQLRQKGSRRADLRTADLLQLRVSLSPIPDPHKYADLQVILLCSCPHRHAEYRPISSLLLPLLLPDPRRLILAKLAPSGSGLRLLLNPMCAAERGVQRS